MDNEIEGISKTSSKGGFLNSKIILLGLPLFVVQLVAVYFIMANIIITRMSPEAFVQQKSETGSQIEGEEDTSKNEGKDEIGKFIYNIEDIIVNPAGTNGQKLMLVSIGFDVGSEEEIKKLESREVVVKDMINSVLTSKSLNKLNNPFYRDTLKAELSMNLESQIPALKINNVYFPKYIIQ